MTAIELIKLLNTLPEGTAANVAQTIDEVHPDIPLGTAILQGLIEHDVIDEATYHTLLG